MNKYKGAFLDRDGPIIVDTGYIDSPDRVQLSEGAVEGLRMLKDHGYKVIIISGQSGVGRGKFTMEQARAVHDRTIELLKEQEVEINDSYYCYHAPDDKCFCRKPQPTQVHEAAKKHNIDLKQSFFGGDKPSDLKTGRNAHPKMKTILIGEKKGEPLSEEELHLANHKVLNLYEAVKWVISREN